MCISGSEPGSGTNESIYVFTDSQVTKSDQNCKKEVTGSETYKVSVIIPNYNHARFLEERMNSILEQTYADFECILLDDGSSDDSREIIQKYIVREPRIKAYFNEKNSGNTFSQWDFGVRISQGEFIWIAESDDFADINFLSEMVSILEENPSVGLVYSNGIFIDGKGEKLPLISDHYSFDKRRSNDYLNNGRNEIENYLYRSNTINNTSGVLFRKSCYIEAGFADKSMKYCGDWFLYIRILLKYDVAYHSRPINFIRFHTGSTFHNYFKDNAYLEEVLYIYMFFPEFTEKNRKDIGDILIKHFISSISKGFLPSASNYYKVKQLVPDFKFGVFKFIIRHILWKLKSLLTFILTLIKGT